MFKWIKTLLRLSRDDDYAASIDAKINDLTKRMEVFSDEMKKTFERLQLAKEDVELSIEHLKANTDELRQLANEAEQKSIAGKTELLKVSDGIRDYEDVLAKKVDELQKTAQEHLDAVSKKVESYDSSVTELSKEIMRLGDSIAEFQKS